MSVERFLLHTELQSLIRAEIEKRGPVSFAWFMDQALYHPQRGYYSSGRATIGRRGDYFTNVSVGPLFGRMLAAQIAEIWERLGQIDNFVIVEQGAHHGDFARDVLTTLREESPQLFAALRYRIIEPFRVLQDRQSEMLAEFSGQVEWRNSVDALESFSGIHFSNELLDAMPVHLIISTGEGWREKRVAIEGNQLVFVQQPITDPALQARLEDLPLHAVGYETEINLAALDWIDHIASKLMRGYLLTVDYGFPREGFYADERSTGTLQVRAEHRDLVSPLELIGYADITAHIDWTSVAEHAEANGLRVIGFTDQHHFLTGVISELPKFLENADAKTKRALQTLLHPEMLGRSFQVLALGKDVDAGAPLPGFKFARDARAALGLKV